LSRTTALTLPIVSPAETGSGTYQAPPTQFTFPAASTVVTVDGSPNPLVGATVVGAVSEGWSMAEVPGAAGAQAAKEASTSDNRLL
jgi:hypothetical protein